MSNIQQRITSLVTIGLFSLALASGWILYYQQQKLANRMLENTIWATYQLDREVRELRLALQSATVSHFDDLLLRYEILYSRVGLFQQGEIREAMLESTLTEPLQDAIQGVYQLENRLKEIESGERLLDRQVKSELDARLVALQDITASLLIDTNYHVATLRFDDRKERMRLYNVVLVLILLLMASGTSQVVTLLRTSRLHKRKNQILKQQTRMLDQTAKQAEEASRAKSNFMAVMTHEIRTPLNGAVGVAELLADEPLPLRGQQLLVSLNESLSALLAVINDVIDYTKYASWGVEFNLQPFEMRAFIAQVARGYEVQDQKSGNTFQVSIADDLPEYVQGDTQRLRQVLMNLLNNAFKFTSEGVISLRVQRTEQGNIRFLVRDSGCGIPEDRREALFTPFTQVDSSISRQYGGSGLGLAICKHLVTAMGGNIEFESHLGLGSLFWFDLPLESVSKEAADLHASLQVTNSEPPILPLPHGRILVVEDHPTNRELAQAMLERLGQTVCMAENGEVAMEYLCRESFDLVLMDIQMPVIDGLETTRRWRQKETPGGHRLPIIAMTANAMSEDQQRCREAGMDDVLSKPFTRNDLYRTLQGVLTRPDDAEGGLSHDTLYNQDEPPLLIDAGSPVENPSADHPLLDAETLASLEQSLGYDTLSELSERFMERLGERHSRMEESLARGDRADLAAAAHALKGAAASMGCTGLAGVAAELERQAPEVDLPYLRTQVERLTRLGETTRSALVQQGYITRRQT